MNRLGRRVCINRAEENQTGIQIIARCDFNCFARSQAVADEDNVILKGANFDCAPGNTLDHAGKFLLRHHDHVANLKRSIRVQRNSGKEISQRVLQCETDDHAEDCRGGEERTEIYFGVDPIEYQDEENDKCDKRKNISHQCWRFKTAANPKDKVKENCGNCPAAKKCQEGPENKFGNLE